MGGKKYINIFASFMEPSIEKSHTICKIFDLQVYRDLNMRVKGHWNRHGSIRHLRLPINVP